MNLTTSQAKGLALTAGAGAFIITSADDIAHGDGLQIRVAVGSLLATTILYALADWVPDFAGAMALLLLVGAILTNGVSFAQVISGATTPAPPK